MSYKDISVFNDKFKFYKYALITYSLCIFVSLFLMICGILESKKDIKYTYLNDLIVEEENNSLKNGYLNIHTEPFAFAEYDDENSTFYIVKDNSYLYIVYLNENEIEKINSIQDIKNNPYRVEGYTEYITEDVKKIAIDAYNDAFGETIVNEENFNSYFGNIYLNTNGVYTNAEIWFLAALLFGISGLIGLVIVVLKSKKSQETLNKLTQADLKKIKKEFDSNDLEFYEKEKLYLTNSYIVSMKSTINVIKYRDIVWFYKEDIRSNGIKTNQSIIVVTKDLVKHTILILRNTKSARKSISKISSLISEKATKALIGYTKTNEEKIYKKIKK